MSSKNKNYAIVQRFLKLLEPHHQEIRYIYVYAIFSGLVSLSLPIGVQSIVNFIQSGQVTTSWVVLVAFVIFGIAAIGILQIYQLRLTERISQKIFVRSSFDFAFRLPKIKQKLADSNYLPELANRFFDTMTLQKGLSKILIDFSSALLQVLFGLILLAFYHPFFLVFSLLLFAFAVVVYKFTAKRGFEFSKKASKHKYQMAHWLQEVARSSETFKNSTDSEYVIHRADEYASKYVKARESHFDILVKQFGMMVVFKIIITSLLLIIGGYMVINQMMNIGQFIASEIVIVMMMGSVEKLIMSLETLYDMMTGLAKISHVTDMDLDDDDSLAAGIDEGVDFKLELNNATIMDSRKGEILFKDLNLIVGNKERLFLEKYNATEKNVLGKVFMGYEELVRGFMLVKGRPVVSEDFRLRIKSFSEEDKLFEGSFVDNISMGAEDVDLRRLGEILELVALESFVKTLDKGLDTIICCGGCRLHSVTKEKILLARLIYAQPELIVVNRSMRSFKQEERESIMDYFVSSERPWSLVLLRDCKMWRNSLEGKNKETLTT
ncbi:ABC transporter ATP-binding protein [Aureibacter tunicatorum]|uniref:ABC-type bacteriocin/lantibiotic exporter with double-glycine peptidase domain n=1 Tax=Aureibacter tunicatorum TaxID=866807 RepID=A0AAE4BU11_9BACT|nr:ABC transporter ATP-binding protein [Aureibacter tunicatorum]MDR6240520.1 ABC-type bacteriocin/lantibiotic exporter with double-glycine peptidase domain [Aureibacter tunicatorum]BDD06619.1 ABC transporter ATP-binding protein [Aureibacter tunicatorum]